MGKRKNGKTEGAKKLKFREKLSFGTLVMASNPLNGLTSGYLLLFYTTIVGLDPIATATLFLVARFVDGISDPIMGFVIDHVHNSKFGKYRFLMIVGAFICGINFLLVWFGPLMVPAGKMAVAYVTYLVFGFTFDLLDVSKNSILPTITADREDIVSIGKFHSLFTILSGLVVSIGAPIILGNDRSVQSYAIVIIAVTAFSILTAVLGASGVRQRVTAVSEDERHSIREYLKIFAHKPVIAMLLYALLFAMATYIINGANTFYFTYVLHDLTSLSWVSMLQLVGIIPGVLLAGVFIKKLGSKKVFLISAVLIAVFCLIRLVNPYSLVPIVISTLATGFVLGAYQPAGSLIGVANVDYVEYKTGYRSEAALASINTFFAKLSSGIAGALPGYLLGICGFVQDGDTQPQAVIMMLILLVTVIPAVVALISGIFFHLLYTVKPEETEQIQKELAERRQKNG